MEVKSIAGHALTPGKTVKDHIHVEGTELHVPHGTDYRRQPQRRIRRHSGCNRALQ